MTLEQVEQLTDDEIRRQCALFRIVRAANACDVSQGLGFAGWVTDWMLDELNQPMTDAWRELYARVRACGIKT